MNDNSEMGDFGISAAELEEMLKKSKLDFIMELESKHGGVPGICNKLRTTVDGLPVFNSEEMKRRQQAFGTNEIPPKKGKNLFKLCLEALNDFTLRILMGAALVSIALSIYTTMKANGPDGEESTNPEMIEGIAIIVTVLIVVMVSAFTNFNRDRKFRKLQGLVNKQSKFLTSRDGKLAEIPNTEIVVGDVCVIKYGDILPADGIVLESIDLKLDESSLTGESDRINKTLKKDIRLLSGTDIVEGKGKMLVLAVGFNSQSGKIIKLIQEGGSPVHQDENETEVVKPRFSCCPCCMCIRCCTKRERENQEEEDEFKSVLQQKLTVLAVRVGYIGTAFAVLTFLVLIIKFSVQNYAMNGAGFDLRHMEQFISFFITGVTILVVAVPEGLPLAVTLALAYSVIHMTKDNNLVRHLNACETMGNATAICSDKTGTLTTNRMEVVAIYVESNFIAPIKGKVSNKISKSVRKLLVDSIALNSSYTSMIVPSEIPGGPPSFMGNMTECALLGLVKELGADYKAIRSAVPDTSFTHVLTFNSDRKSMTTMVRSELVGYKPGHYVIHTKGASEIVLKHCERVLVADGNEEIISPETLASINKIISTMAANALRTIGLSFKILPDTADLEDDSATLESQTLIAICGIEDPVREEVPAAVAACQRAGITVRMLTGDNLNTAKSIATQCGILSSDESDVLAMEGTEFNKKIKDPDSGQVIQSQLDKIWPKLRVLARCLPEDKYNLVRGMRMAKPVGASRNREVVAVTGDGTNDAPALKMADVGFAMGITGTDVAKEASDIILMDDNFTSIVKAVMWGRTVFDNICKFLQFQLTVNLVALVISFTSACVLNDSPLRAVQMLWVNMVMDTLASVALSSENPSEDVLERLPVGSASNIVTKDMFSLIVGMAFYMLVVLLTVQYYGPKMFRMSDMNWKAPYARYGPSEHHTLVFNIFVLMILFNEINCRRLGKHVNPFAGLGPTSMFLWLWLGCLTFHVVIVQFGSCVFFTYPLDLVLWSWSLLFGIGIILWRQIFVLTPNYLGLGLLYDKIAAWYLSRCRKKEQISPKGSVDGQAQSRTSFVA